MLVQIAAKQALLLRQLCDSFFGVWADVICNNNQAQQLKASGMCCNLLLSHLRQVQLVHVGHLAHCYSHQPKALLTVLINNLQSK